MTRQRAKERNNSSTNNSSKERRSYPNYRPQNKQKSANNSWNNRLAIFISLNISVVILSVVYFVHQHNLENAVITMATLPQVVTKQGLDVPNLFWGSYRPGSYFGMRTRSPQTVAAGIMWFTQKIVNNNIKIRHWCEQWDEVENFSWIEHDGENFGIQKIQDKEYDLVTSFVKQSGGKHGGDFTTRISVKPKESSIAPVPVSLMFYVFTTSDGALKNKVVNDGHLVSIHGSSEAVGDFTFHFRELESSKTILKYNYLSAEAASMAHLQETVHKHHAYFQAKERAGLQILGLIGDAAAYTRKTDKTYKPNFMVYQVTFIPPFELEVYFQSQSFTEREVPIVGDTYLETLNLHMNQFEQKFEDIFHLKGKGYTLEERSTAWAALSNMIGGIGYFHGSSLVQSVYNKAPLNYPNAPLYTAVPSRSFFPRGFLWDEGFHNLLILEWNPEFTKDIISHWLDLMNDEGWIPREQILGPEARQRVPAEFVVQKNSNANPPTLFLTLERLLYKMKLGQIPTDVDFLQRSLPRLKKWFDWFNQTQSGMLAATYRWRGRDQDTRLELNPKTLSSGLDDFPRASHPTVDERHLDLRCWLTHASGVLSDIAEFLGENSEKYRSTHLYLSDNELLDKLHWSPESESYSDYGFHSKSVKLIKEKPPYIAGSSQPPPQPVTVRVVKEEPALRFVDNFGYVSLFPFILKIINPENPKLGKVLQDLKNPKLLWTSYGLRSLARNSPYYNQRNTEHDPPYWRGSIWININFLAVRALGYYGKMEGPYKYQSKLLYDELRNIVVKNILSEYKRTGFIWEQYDDKTGYGKGVHPFTGWSALFVLLMGEVF